LRGQIEEITDYLESSEKLRLLSIYNLHRLNSELGSVTKCNPKSNWIQSGPVKLTITSKRVALSVQLMDWLA
jgi:hypothetical protein